MSIISVVSANDTSALDELEKCMRSGRVCVLFYANWCGYCQQLKPEWGRLKDMFSSSYNSSTANCSLAEVESEAMDAAKDRMSDMIDFSGYPTISMYDGGKKLGDYQGERTADAIMANLSSTFGTSAKSGSTTSNNTKNKKHKKHKKNHKNTKKNTSKNNKNMRNKNMRNKNQSGGRKCGCSS